MVAFLNRLDEWLEEHSKVGALDAIAFGFDLLGESHHHRFVELPFPSTHLGHQYQEANHGAVSSPTYASVLD
jgi:hypothetical protein